MNKLFNPLQMIQRAASPCGGLDMGADYNCENPIVAGVSQRLILIDYSDFLNAIVTFDVSITTLITNIVLSNIGDAGYAFQGVKKSLVPQSAFVPATVSVGYDHQVTFQIFDISQEQKDNIQKMALSKVVAIIENANAIGNSNSVFEVFGKDVGMEIQAGAMRINGDLETNGSYTIDLKTSDDSGKEPKLPTSWWDTDYATTKPLVDALLIPVT